MSLHRSRLLATLCGGLAGLFLALGDAGSTLAYLRTIPRGFQGLPRPTNLDWILAWAGTTRVLSAVGWLLGILAPLALLGLGLLVFRTLNPDFHLILPPPPDAEPGAVLRQPIHRWRLRQIGGALVVTLWLLGYIGAWLPWGRGAPLGVLLAGPGGLPRLLPDSAATASVAGLALLLGGLWLVWGEAGLLRPQSPEAARVKPGRALAAAALAGVALTPFALPLADWAQSAATQVLQGIGGAARGEWLEYLGGIMGVYPLALAAAGWTAMSLAQWTHFPRERQALAAGGLVAVAAWVGVGGLFELAGGGRFDLGLTLSEATGVARGPAGTMTTLTLLPGPRPVVGVTPLISGQGLAATKATGRLMWAYLQRRRFRTVHLFPALMHVCQAEALAWNSDRFLNATLRSLGRNPHPGFCQLLVEKLAHSAATPTARAALARLHDPRQFYVPPGEERGLAALQLRLGPAGGEIRGRLLAIGVPVSELRVGLVNERFWQQLRGVPTALSHRLVVTSAELEENGGFRLRQVPAGRYLLLVGIPTLGEAWAPFRAVVQGSPGPIQVRAGGPSVEVGTIRLLLIGPPRPPGEQARGNPF
jgi:hypothetical protein